MWTSVVGLGSGWQSTSLGCWMKAVTWSCVGEGNRVFYLALVYGFRIIINPLFPIRVVPSTRSCKAPNVLAFEVLFAHCLIRGKQSQWSSSCLQERSVCPSVLIYSLLRQRLILQTGFLLSLCIYFWQEQLLTAWALKTSSVLIVVRENEEAISHIRFSPCMKNASLSRLKINAWYNMSHIKQVYAINWHAIH